MKIGTYGIVAPSGMVWNTDTATWLATSKLDWMLAQPSYPYTNSMLTMGAQLKAAGKRMILRTMPWDAQGLPTTENWSTLRADSAKYSLALGNMIQQIKNLGVSNMYACTISEEEPPTGFATNEHQHWIGPLTPTQYDDFIYVYNKMYDDLKLAFPGIKIFFFPTLSYISDAQFPLIKFDGLIGDFYPEYPEDMLAFATRLKSKTLDRSLSIDDSCFLVMYAAIEGLFSNPPADPIKIRPTFDNAMSAGITNISFYCTGVYKGIGNMLFNPMNDDGVTMTSPEAERMGSVYLHQVEMFKIIDEFYDPIVTVYKCPICGQEFPTQAELDAHILTHNNPIPVQDNTLSDFWPWLLMGAAGLTILAIVVSDD